MLRIVLDHVRWPLRGNPTACHGTDGSRFLVNIIQSISTSTCSPFSAPDTQRDSSDVDHHFKTFTHMPDKALNHSAADYCGTFYASRLLALSVGKIQSMVEQGELEAWKTTGGHRRISIASIRAYQTRLGVKAPAPETRSPVMRLVVIDDDASTRELMSALFSRWKLPIDCTIMASGLEALIDMQNLRPDVLLTDLNMPGVDGFALLRTLRMNSAFEKLVMVATTGLSAQDIEERGGLPERTIVLNKPVDPAWIQGFVTALLVRHTMSALPDQKLGQPGLQLA